MDRIKVVAFDCDGVLLDSKRANISYYNYILSHLGLPPLAPEQEDYVHMLSVYESLKFLIKDPEKLKKAIEFAKTIDFRIFNNYLKPEPGVRECLSKLKPHYFLALATNRTASTHEVLRYFDLHSFFDVVVCALDVPEPKPSPKMMEKILDHLKAKPEEVVYIGDSIIDALFAKSSGVFFIAYKNKELEANLHINSFNELLKWLDFRNSG